MSNKASATKAKNNALRSLPQFRSVFPCEAILYVEMSFWALYVVIRIFGASWVLSGHAPTQANGEYENHKRNAAYPRNMSE